MKRSLMYIAHPSNWRRRVATVLTAVAVTATTFTLTPGVAEATTPAAAVARAASSCNPAPNSNYGTGMGGSYTAIWTNECSGFSSYAWVTCGTSAGSNGQRYGSVVTGNGSSKASCPWPDYIYHWGYYSRYNSGSWVKYTWG